MDHCEIATLLNSALTEEKIEAVEAALLPQQQVNCPVTHIFGPGVYVREMSAPAGTFLIGHYHNFEHINIFLKGKVVVLSENGTPVELAAPMTFVGRPGRKVGYILEDMVWQNVFATEETDVEVLENTLITKSKTAIGFLASPAPRPSKDEDVEDYSLFLQEFGLTDEFGRAMSERTEDLIPFPHGPRGVVVSNSPLGGKGLFASANFEIGDIITFARIGNGRTPAGRYVNHAKHPNAAPERNAEGDLLYRALTPIRGSCGGFLGDEITIDYRSSARLNGYKQSTSVFLWE